MDDHEFQLWLAFVVKLVLPLVLVLLAMIVGTILEKRHYASILRREAELHHIVVVALKQAPEGCEGGQLVRGSVVVSSDYFRRFLASLRQIVGGPVQTFETLLDRGRREAILRMKAEAAALGANAVFNVKIETASMMQSGSLGTAEVIAYGTAGRLPDA
ncbi:MAG: heavy metal-binding domain-containing protein [Lautropia sp.]|nr:heavy metal-binding domain-containing protein [Lautropia sp.]